jgi:antitoxin VapB
MNMQFKPPRVARIFQSNRSQAVRIPKDIAFPDSVEEVVVRRVGHEIILCPKEHLWDSFFNRGPNPDFPERDQPPHQERDWSLDD